LIYWALKGDKLSPYEFVPRINQHSGIHPDTLADGELGIIAQALVITDGD
jgi:hypothetical protein